jgi:AsmA protein
MRKLKIAAYVAAGLVGLVIVALVAVVLLVDPNDYRDDIERVVKTQTGRDFSLSGELKLSIFPWLALETGAASLGEAPGFGTEPFVSIQEARVSVRFLPLLRGKIEVGSVRLVGARIRLITDAQGRNNWADLGKGDDGAAQAASDEPLELPTIAGLEIKDAAVTMEDRKANTRTTVRDFNLETGALESGEPFDLKTNFVLDRPPSMALQVHMSTTVTADLQSNAHRLAEPKIDVTITGSGYPSEGILAQIRAASLEADIGKKRHKLDSFKVSTIWKGTGLPSAGVPIELTAQQLTADLAAQTLALTGLQLQVAGAQLAGVLNGVEILDAPRVTGSLELQPISPREWLPKVGVELPTTRDPDVYKRLSFASKVTLTKTSVELGDIALQLDDTTAKGSVGVADLEAKALRFDLNVDRVNADRYLPPPTEAPATKTSKEPPADIPVEALRSLNARGQLQVGEAIFAGMKFTKLKLGLNARDGTVRFNPAQASMYGGQYRGDIGIDATTDRARVSLDEHVSGVDFAPLFKDLFETQRVSGKGSANIRLTGVGRNTDDIMQTLDGNVDFNVADGALEGADLWYEIRRARAVLKAQAVPERSGPARTPFDKLQGTGVMKNGVLSNNDLAVSMQYLRVAGKGAVDLPQNTLDYGLNVAILKVPPEGADAAQMQELVDAEIPVKVTGSLTDPKVRPDIEGYLKTKVKQRVDEQRDKVEQKLKDKLGDKLKDIFKR